MLLDRPHMISIAAICTVLFSANGAIAEGSPVDADCFDALVSARVIREIPSVPPKCDDCIIMNWPWFIDLEVERVLQGDGPKGRLRVLTVQHTYDADRGAARWHLRRNSVGGFNVVYPDEPSRLCARDAGVATPYIQPAEGQTLDGLLEDGRRMFGDGPD